MAEKLFQMAVERVPYSSIVGQSISIVSKEHGVVALLMVSVPQPRMDYRMVSDAVVKAILNGHVSRDGATLVLPDDFPGATP